MSMSVNQMLLLSRVFFGAMILLVIVTIVIYFVFDIRRAWKIITNKSIPMKKGVPKSTDDFIKKQSQTKKLQLPNEEITQTLKKGEYAESLYEGKDVTTVLRDSQDTVLLFRNDVQDNENNILLDITFIHTKLVI